MTAPQFPFSLVLTIYIAKLFWSICITKPNIWLNPFLILITFSTLRESLANTNKTWQSLPRESPFAKSFANGEHGSHWMTLENHPVRKKVNDVFLDFLGKTLHAAINGYLYIPRKPRMTHGPNAFMSMSLYWGLSQTLVDKHNNRKSTILSWWNV